MQNNILKYFFLLALFFMLPSFVWAAPDVTNVDGVFTDGQSINLSGTGFGANAAIGTSNISFLHDNIEAGMVGAVQSGVTGWHVSNHYPENPKVYANDYAHSGTKSLKGSTNATYYNNNIVFDLATPSSKMYVSYWVRHDNAYIGSYQWKRLRFSTRDWVSDGYAILATGFGGNGLLEEKINENYTVANLSGSSCGSPGACYADTAPRPDNQWYRSDFWVDADQFDQTTWLPGNTKRFASSHNWAVYNYSYLIWQDYTGNGTSNATIWSDDYFVQVGTQARVELCDASTYAASTHCEIQLATTWNSNGQAIESTVNQGSFAAEDPAFLYVIDANGEANAGGFPIQFSSGVLDIVAPSAPSGLAVQ